ncbi:unnamed protein product [Urochloa humidicola]
MHAIPDELLELILLHVASAICLTRSASVCKRWLAIVSGAGFLRRFRSVHGPAGVYKDERWLRNTLPNVDPYLPKFVPSQPSAMDVRRFSLDFLPHSGIRPWLWRILDSHGSLLLLDKKGGYYYNGGVPSRDMIVCEPVTRRYQRIALHGTFPHCAVDGIECAYVADGEEGGGNGFLLNFRLVVLLNIHGYDHGCGRSLHAAVLTPGGGSWKKVCIEEQQMSLMGHTKGCVYWYEGGRTVVALDRSTAEISSFALSGSIEAWHSFHADSTAVAVGRDGEPRVVTVAGAGRHLKVFSRLQGGNGGGGGEWALEKSVPLSEAMRSLTECDRSLLRSRTFTFAHNNEGKLLLRVHAGTVLPCLYHLDVETVELQSVDDYGLAYPCELPWPPALHAFNLH